LRWYVPSFQFVRNRRASPPSALSPPPSTAATSTNYNNKQRHCYNHHNHHSRQPSLPPPPPPPPPPPLTTHHNHRCHVYHYRYHRHHHHHHQADVTRRARHATTGSGQLFDVTNQACVSVQPDESQWATAARMLAAEQDISGIETQLDQTGGNHSVCTICQLNQYVSQACTATVGTRCANCATGSYSRGGYTEQCIACADNVQQCGYATCTSSTDASCQYCSQTVENGAAFILSAANTCTQCPLYTYRSDNTTCSACPKDDTVSRATPVSAGQTCQGVRKHVFFRSFTPPPPPPVLSSRLNHHRCNVCGTACAHMRTRSLSLA
jgi:hypothetical protein